MLDRTTWPAALAACLSLFAGCASVPPAGLYGAAEGPHAVKQSSQLILTDPAQPRDIRLRVTYPASEGRFPVVVFSHGAFCYPDQYAVITDHWVSHGYVVVLPDHLDSPNTQPPLRPDRMGGLFASRVADLDFIYGHLDEIAGAAGIPGRIDASRLGVAGHSFGTVIAMAKVGLWVRTSADGPRQHRDDRIRGAVLMSGVGQLDDMMGPDAFRDLTVPLIATGGTLDTGNVGGPVTYPWEWRMSPFTLAPPGDKYSVVLENGDHYLGGLICRKDRGGEDDPEGAAIDAALTLAFLDAYVKQDPEAARFLSNADVPARSAGRARFSRK